MHPIERLRFVARSRGADAELVAAEAAWALADLAATEPAALVAACRRLLEHQPDCGPLWWTAACVLGSPDPVAEAARCAEQLVDDPTEGVLEASLPQGQRVVRRGGVAEVARAELVVIEARAMGPDGLAAGDDRGLLRAARAAGVPVWVRAGVGTVLPVRLWEGLLRLSERHGVPCDPEPFDGVCFVVGPGGPVAPAAAVARVACPEPATLTGTW